MIEGVVQTSAVAGGSNLSKSSENDLTDAVASVAVQDYDAEDKEAEHSF